MGGRTAFLLLTATSLCWCQPSEIHLGLVFPMFPLYPVSDQDFKANYQGRTKNTFDGHLYKFIGIQVLQAVIMAIEEINEKKYLQFIYDSLLPNTQLKLVARANLNSYTKSINETISIIRGGYGVDVGIGAVYDNQTESLASIYQDNNVAQIGYNLGIRFSLCGILMHNVFRVLDES